MKRRIPKSPKEREKVFRELLSLSEKSECRIESVEYFIEDIDKYYNHHGKKDLKEGLKEKVGLVVSLSAFFAGMEME